MKFIVRWLFRLLILGLVLAVAAVLLKDAMLKEFAEARIRRDTGLEAQIGRFELGLLSPTITFENLRLYNPPEFGGTPFAVVPELHLEYDREALRRQAFRCRLLRLNLAELTLVQDTGGRWNLAEIQARTAKARAERAAPLAFAGIDTLNVTIGQVRRYSMREPARVSAYPVGLRGEILTNLRTAQDVQSAIALLAFKAGLQHFFPFATPTNTVAVPSAPGSAAAAAARARER